MTILPHHPSREAAEVLGDGHLGLVLEPSPPAIADAPFMADDPTARPSDTGDLVVISPTSSGDRSWEDVVAARPELREWAAARWLAARPPLPAVPRGYPPARDAYHRLAYSVIAEARRLATTKFGLRYTRGGFGTPFFGADRQVRVEHGRLVVQDGMEARDTEITSITAAAAFVGVEPDTEAQEHDSPPLGDVDAPLGADPLVGEFLGAWFGFSWAVLEELRLTPDAVDVGRPQLWPGHFDPALEMGPVDAGRATYGCSPGDADHDEPYLYVAAWGEIDRRDMFWNSESFNGGSLPYAELRAAADPFAAALGFFRAGYRRLVSPAGGWSRSSSSTSRPRSPRSR